MGPVFKNALFPYYLNPTVKIKDLARALELAPLGSLFFLLFLLTEN